MKTIGIKIREYAEQRFGSKKPLSDLAEALDMKLPSLYTYLNDKSMPGTPMLKKLLSMGCDINWLIGGDSDLKTSPKATRIKLEPDHYSYILPDENTFTAKTKHQHAPTLGDRLKLFVKTNFKSVADFSRKMMMSRENIYRYFNNESPPDANFLRKLKDYGCDINWLLSDEEEKTELAVSEPKAEYNNIAAQNKKLLKEVADLKRKLKIAQNTINKLLEQ